MSLRILSLKTKKQNLQGFFFFNYIYALWKCIYTSIENPIQLNWCSDKSQHWDILKHEGIQSMESTSPPTNETNYERHFYD